MPMDAILFDWDGVLYDGMRNMGLAAIEVCKSFGKDISMEYFMEHYIQPWWRFYQNLGIPAESEEERAHIYELFHAIDVASGRKARLYTEAPEALRALKGRGLQLGIMSAEKLEKIHKVLDEEGHVDIFDRQHIVGYMHEKTEAIRAFCRENRLAPERVLMVGDLPSDLEDARQAGTRVALIARFEGAEERLAACKPDFLIRDLRELIGLTIPAVALP